MYVNGYVQRKREAEVDNLVCCLFRNKASSAQFLKKSYYKMDISFYQSGV